MIKSKLTKLIVAAGALLTLTTAGTSMTHADSVAGDIYLTLGEDLKLDQVNKVYENLGLVDDISEDNIVYVSNEEEHQYLGEYLPKMQIGTNALSSSKIEIGESGTGLVVEVDNNINYITEEMYTNALSTAGVTDVKISVTAPFEVSGTAALTGIIKAYEVSTGELISEEQKQLANEEMVETAEIELETGDENVTKVIQLIKEELSKQTDDLSDEELIELIKKVAKENNVSLTEDQIKRIMKLVKKVNDLNIDWEKVNKTIDSAKDKWNELSESETVQKAANSFIQFFKDLFNAIADYFKR